MPLGPWGGSMFNRIYENTRVLVTGHTGFKGSWLVFWLQKLGARVYGYSLASPTQPSHWDLLKLDIPTMKADVRDLETLDRVVKEFQPKAVFHLAAQPLVRLSYENPIETYGTNVMGTLNLLEACRRSKSVRAIVNVTSDKCYENREWVWGYRENDPMGGHDPYSSSKGCAELLTASYRNSYFPEEAYGQSHTTLLASCRAGNVIGGGDWAQDRLVPDIMKAAHENREVLIRNPRATRPWQHVLEPLSGYLLVGQKLLEGDSSCAGAWNFGPSDELTLSVGELVQRIKRFWPQVDYRLSGREDQPHEAQCLKLDCSKARLRLAWTPVWGIENTVEKTVTWYRRLYEHQELMTASDLEDYEKERL